MWQNAQNYWNNADTRERYTLLVGAVITVAMIIWLLLFQPLNSALHRQERINKSLSQQWLVAKQSAQQLQQTVGSNHSGTSSLNTSENISQAISNSLAAHNLSLSSYQPNGSSSAIIQFEDAKFQSLLPWLNDVDQSSQLQLQQIKLKALDSNDRISAHISLGTVNEN